MFSKIGAWILQFLLEKLWAFLSDLIAKWKRKKDQEEPIKKIEEAVEQKLPPEEQEKRERDFLNS